MFYKVAPGTIYENSGRGRNGGRMILREKLYLIKKVNEIKISNLF